ncbi:TPA: hypothetical protein I7748_10065 [Vibrio vulnificus]|nr:hypothetical protein [Vibrio vulnificus]
MFLSFPSLCVNLIVSCTSCSIVYSLILLFSYSLILLFSYSLILLFSFPLFLASSLPRFLASSLLGFNSARVRSLDKFDINALSTSPSIAS